MKDDYNLELGTLHSSGVACLLGNPALQRAACVEQYHGGLRCYDGYDSVPTVAPDQLEVCAWAGRGGERGGQGWTPPAWTNACPTPDPDNPTTTITTTLPGYEPIICEGVTASGLPSVAGCRRLEETEQ